MLENGGVENNEKQKEWIDMSTNLITGFMLMNFAKKRYTFNQMMQLICTAPIYVPIPKEEEIEEKKAKNEEIDIPYSLYYDVMVSGVKSAQEEMESFMAGYQAQSTVGSIRMVLNTVAKLFRKEVVTRLIDKPSIDFKKFREEESILFIQIPERHADFFKPIVATLITQLIDVLLDNDGLQVYMLLDEFSNIGKIPSFAKLLSTARKHRLSIFVFVQSLMQLERTYGNDGKEIRELFKTLLLTGGLKDSTEYFSKLIGKDNEDKPLMSEEELRMMDEDEMIIICNNKRPVKDYMLDIMRG
jgi:type IV secretion system protein VirD4